MIKLFMLLPQISRNLANFVNATSFIVSRHINHNSKNNMIISKVDEKKANLWALYNEVVYPPQDPLVHGPDVKRRPVEVTHQKSQLMISRKRALLLAHLISGKTISEALLQLNYRNGKAERILEEAVEIGVRDHNIEFRTKLFVESCHVSRGNAVPRVYKGLRTEIRQENYHYTNLYLRIREISSDDPKFFHPNDIPNAWTPRPTCPADGSPGWGTTKDMALRHLSKLRSRKIKGAY